MFLIDQYAYQNKLNKVHPGEKAIFGLLTMFAAIVAKSVAVQLVIFTMMVLVTLWLAGIPKKVYFSLLLFPLSFIFIGVIPILVAVSSSNEGLIYSIKAFSSYIGITNQGISSTSITITRSMSSVACLYFIALTTPLIDLIELLKTIRIPKIIIELMTLIYRFIFVLIDASYIIYKSQNSRLGYSSISTSFRSLGKLVSMVFIKAYNNSQSLYLSLISRGYSGELTVISSKYEIDKRNIAAITVIELILIGLMIKLGGL